MAFWNWLWPPSRMKLRRERFLHERESLADTDFLCQVGVEGSLESAIAIALRRSVAEACSVPPEKSCQATSPVDCVHPSDPDMAPLITTEPAYVRQFIILRSIHR